MRLPWGQGFWERTSVLLALGMGYEIGFGLSRLGRLVFGLRPGIFGVFMFTSLEAR